MEPPLYCSLVDVNDPWRGTSKTVWGETRFPLESDQKKKLHGRASSQVHMPSSIALCTIFEDVFSFGGPMVLFWRRTGKYLKIYKIRLLD